jgi:hypothetical protein
MKKLVILLTALSVASFAHAGASCGGCSGEKSADKKTEAPAKPTEETKA